MMESMDTAVGAVVGKLRELGLEENTIICFTADNGGLSTSEGSPTSNLPLRGGKGWLYDTSNDISEQKDIASGHPERVAEMRRRLHDWYREVDAKFLSAKENGPEPWKP